MSHFFPIIADPIFSVPLSHKWKIVSLFFLFVSIAVFWNYDWIQPLKLIVVFFHEVSHGMGALLTGGQVNSIFISWDESGYTVTEGGNFLTIASAGYIGCMLWGSLMLYTSLSSKYCEYYSIVLGIVIAFFMLRFSSGIENSIYFLILGWSVFFIVTGILLQKVSRYALFYMGGITSLYGLFDLFDFFRGSIRNTDAGKIAKYYVNDPLLEKVMAYAIAFLISVVSIWILYRIIARALLDKEEESAAPTDETPTDEATPATTIDPELIEKLERLVNHTTK